MNNELNLEQARARFENEILNLGDRCEASAVTVPAIGRALHATMIMLAFFDKRLTRIENSEKSPPQGAEE